MTATDRLIDMAAQARAKRKNCEEHGDGTLYSADYWRGMQTGLTDALALVANISHSDAQTLVIDHQESGLAR